MYWNTLIVLGIYLSLQLIMGILTLIFTDQPGSRKTDVGIRGGNNVDRRSAINPFETFNTFKKHELSCARILPK